MFLVFLFLLERAACGRVPSSNVDRKSKYGKPRFLRIDKVQIVREKKAGDFQYNVMSDFVDEDRNRTVQVGLRFWAHIFRKYPDFIGKRYHSVARDK